MALTVFSVPVAGSGILTVAWSSPLESLVTLTLCRGECRPGLTLPAVLPIFPKSRCFPLQHPICKHFFLFQRKKGGEYMSPRLGSRPQNPEARDSLSVWRWCPWQHSHSLASAECPAQLGVKAPCPLQLWFSAPVCTAQSPAPRVPPSPAQRT